MCGNGRQVMLKRNLLKRNLPLINSQVITPDVVLMNYYDIYYNECWNNFTLSPHVLILWYEYGLESQVQNLWSE